MNFLRQKSATVTVEWLVTAAIIVAVLGGVMLLIYQTLAAKLQAVNDAL